MEQEGKGMTDLYIIDEAERDLQEKLTFDDQDYRNYDPELCCVCGWGIFNTVGYCDVCGEHYRGIK